MEAVRQALPTTAGEHAAAAVTSTLVGALQLARALGDTAEGRAVLASARHAILDQYDREANAPQHQLLYLPPKDIPSWISRMQWF
ncbi:hypothetical protein G6F61_014734 [Rhizopus arrhizus]|nr:hypothetical protein G6F61_014734 [Rhizopus arrhizus]